MGWAEGPAHFLEAQRLFENDGTPYFVSLARGTKLFFKILRKYGTPSAINCTTRAVLGFETRFLADNRRVLQHFSRRIRI